MLRYKFTENDIQKNSHNQSFDFRVLSNKDDVVEFESSNLGLGVSGLGDVLGN